ncbi:MFS transporter [Streptomyces sp. NPDC101152]|uniref:MFS transporter n=1 Tax=Streptomyces sp. NPDC101152 TaxID=3366116 RepID=UPI0037F43D3C
MSRLHALSVVSPAVLSTFLTALDGSIVNVALPQIRRELSLSETDLKWVATAYPLTLASLLLMAGQLTDTKGRRWALLTGVATFTVASVCCALSATGMMLVCSRALQGAGAAFILPSSLAIMSRDVPRRARTAAFGATSATMASALAFGPVISGVVTQHLGWEWLFALNIPLGLAGFVIGAAVIPGARRRSRDERRQSAAVVPHYMITLACLSLAALAYFLIQGPSYGFTKPSVMLSGIAGGTGLLTLYGVRRPERSPALVMLLRQRAFAGGVVTQLLWGLGVSGVYFYTSQFLQNSLQLSPTEAGLTFTPVVCALFVTVPFVGALARRWGDARIASSGLVLVAAGLLLVALGSHKGGLVDLLPGLAAVGAGSALALPLTTRALGASPDNLSGFAAGLFSAARELSGVFGIVLVGAVVTFVQNSIATRGTTDAQAFATGYQAGLCVAAALVGAGVPVALWALRCSPQVMRNTPIDS